MYKRSGYLCTKIHFCLKSTDCLIIVLQSEVGKLSKAVGFSVMFDRSQQTA